MPSRRARTRIYLAIVAILALGFVLPPTINLKHFRVRLSESLSRSLGRPVSVQDVRLRLLPLPGFSFHHLRIEDDEEFGSEPILQTNEDGQSSDATLRLASLWRGRLEIASVSLTHASLNLARSADGHWNLERLINRAAQVPSAPTSEKKPEARPRFPYIEVKDSRINFKFGAEKKPFALSDAEFALWLAAENRWNVRLKAIPLRTDQNISDTGVIRISGSFDRAGQFAQTPFHFTMDWDRPEVNAITRIAHGHDPGWRGAVYLSAEIKGTPRDFAARLQANIDEFRRYDIARPSSFDLRVTCNHRFRAEIAETHAFDQLDFHCKLPMESGVLTAEGELHPLGKSPDFTARLFASKLPVSGLMRALLHAKSTLPDDLSGQGAVDGQWTIQRVAGSAVSWTGALTLTKVSIQSRALTPALSLPEVVRVDFETPVLPVPSQRSRKTVPSIQLSRAVVEPFKVDLGQNAEVAAVFDPSGYRMEVDGPVEWQRLIQAARAIGLHPPATDLRGSGTLHAQYSGEWQHFAPAAITAEAHIGSAVLSLRGFAEPLHISDGSVKLDGQSFHAQQIAAEFPLTKLAFIADLSGKGQCERHVICDVKFALDAETVSQKALADLLSVPESGIPLPFVNSGREFEAKWLFDVASEGTMTAAQLSLPQLQAKSVTAQVRVSRDTILVPHWSADILGGRQDGSLTIDLAAKLPAITAEGSIRDARVDQLSIAPGEQADSGALDVKYQLAMAGASAEQLANSATGSGTFSWSNGVIHTVRIPGDRSSTLAFNSWSGGFQIADHRISLRNTWMTSGSGIRKVAGELSFGRKWNLTLARAAENGVASNSSIATPIVSEATKLVAR